MFDNLTDQDAFWATRIILSFTEPEIRSMVGAGQYLDPKDSDYIVRTLVERQRILTKYWLSKVDALSGFSIQPAKGGVTLAFRDLMLDHKLADAASTRYTYEIKGPVYKSAKKTTRDHGIVLSRADLAAAIEGTRGATPIEIKIWTNRQTSTSPPVTIQFGWNPSLGATGIQRISRG